MKPARILYHNVLGYNLTTAGNEVADRANIMLAIYQEYQPDVLCFQEMTADFRNDSNAQALMNWLNENYIEKSFDGFSLLALNPLENCGGTPTPIFIRKDSGLTVIDAGYIRAREKATKGTTWVILQDASGKVFCVSNSHFVSPTEKGSDSNYLEMRQLRTDDANAWLKTKLPAIQERFPQIPVLSGGDFNSGKEYLLPNDSGMQTPWELFVGKGYTDIRSEENDSIDHALRLGNITVVSYCVLPGGVSVCGSDHPPHYADIIVN